MASSPMARTSSATSASRGSLSRRLARGPVAAVVVAAVALAGGHALADSPSQPGFPTQITLFPVADSYVVEFAPTSNFGTEETLVLGAGGNYGKARALLAFDLSDIPTAATIEQAALEAYAWFEEGDAQLTAELRRTTIKWAEEDVTWNTKPGASDPYTSTLVGDDPGYKTWDATALVDEWHRGVYDSDGVMLQSADEEAWSLRWLRSREAAENTPRLVVTFLLPTATPTAAPTATATATAAVSATVTATPTPVASDTATPTRVPSLTATLTSTPTSTVSPTTAATPTASAAPTATADRVCAADPYEPNDQAASATRLEPGKEYEGLLCPESDRDYFVFSVPDGSQFRVELVDLPADYQLTLFGPDGTWLDHAHRRGRLPGDIQRVAPQGGDHTVLVSSLGQAYDASATYILRVTLGAIQIEAVPAVAYPGGSAQLIGRGLSEVADPGQCEILAYWDAAAPERLLGRTPLRKDGGFALGFTVPQTAGRGVHRVQSELACEPSVHGSHAGAPPLGAEHVARAPGGPSAVPRLGTQPDLARDASAHQPTIDLPDAYTTVDLGLRDRHVWDLCSILGAPPALPELDLLPLGIEVTQGVQCFDPTLGDVDCPDNSVPLIERRPTVARLYVDAGGIGLGERVDGVTGVLYVRREGDDPPGTPLYPVTSAVPVVGVPLGLDPLDNLRADARKTLNFRIPEDWLTGRVLLRAQVEPDTLALCGTGEAPAYRANNWTDDLVVDFESHGPLSIAHVPVRVRGEMPDPRVDRAWEWLYKVWPVGDPPAYERRADPLDIDWVPNNEARAKAVLRPLNRIYAGWLLAHILGGRQPPRILFGWAPGEDAPYGWADVAWLGGTAVVAFAKDIPDRFEKDLVHEAGHDFEQHHLWVPGFWPYDDQTIQEIGFDVAELRAVPARLKDAMSTGSENVTAVNWVAPYTYKSIYEAEPYGTWLAASRPDQPAQQVVAIIQGSVLASGGGHLDPVLRVRSEVEPPIDGVPDGTEYCVEFVAEDDGVLAARCFDVDFEALHGAGQVDEASFTMVEPYPPGTRGVRLSRTDELLDELEASPSVPQVTVVAPNGGESWNGPADVRWNATDADGDALTYSLLYSRDDGASWDLIAHHVTGQSYEWDTRLYGGSDRMRVRVVATDGLNTAFDDSDAAFAVPGKPPTVQIARPGDRSHHTWSEGLLLLGRATDLEDDELRGEGLVWRSDRDGDLGHGNQVVVPELTRGRHVISLTATDSTGRSATAEVTVDVGHRIWLPLGHRPAVRGVR